MKLTYTGSDKFKQRVVQILNQAVIDVIQDGESVVDSNGVAYVSGGGGGGGSDVQILSNTEAYWNSQPTLVASANTIYIYTDHDTVGTNDIPAIKIGDGVSYLIDMAFISNHDSELLSHINNTTIHVTSANKSAWDEKVRCYVPNVTDNDTIVFTTTPSS